MNDGQGYSCWCENGYEYIKHKIDLDNIDGSVALPKNLPLRDRLVCIDVDECDTIHPCQGQGSHIRLLITCIRSPFLDTVTSMLETKCVGDKFEMLLTDLITD